MTRLPRIEKPAERDQHGDALMNRIGRYDESRIASSDARLTELSRVGLSYVV